MTDTSLHIGNGRGNANVSELFSLNSFITPSFYASCENCVLGTRNNADIFIDLDET